MAAATATQWAPATFPRPSSSASSASTDATAATTACSAQSSASSSSSSRAPRKERSAETYDRFYGHRYVSELSEAVISALFACPLDSSSSSAAALPVSNDGRPTPRLAEFIAYALHRTRLPDEITFQALFLLRRLKSRFPAARGSSGHRLFISALMLASKSSCDDTYSNKSWTIVSQGLFSLREVNQMERELFGYLGYMVNVEPEELEAFTILLYEGELSAVVDLQGSCNADGLAAVPSAACPTQQAMAVNDADAEASALNATPTKSASVDAIHSTSHLHAAALAAAAAARRASVSGYPCAFSTSNPPMSSESSDFGEASTAHAHGYEMRAHYAMHPSYSMHAQQAAASAAAAAAARSASSTTHISPSMASIVSSSRGSVSSASTYSATPSPSSMSQAGDSGSSSRESPDTPPSDFDASPWTDDGKPAFIGGEPAGTYERQCRFYEHFERQQQYPQQLPAAQYFPTFMRQGGY